MFFYGIFLFFCAFKASAKETMHRIAKFLLWILGWKLQGRVPEDQKYIIAVAPHTSYWDFVIGRLVASVMRQNVHFLIKKELFFFPYSLLLKALKAIPVNRNSPRAMIESVLQKMQGKKKFVLVVTPEGTRKKTNRWKKGFYFMANKVDIPILPAAIDYDNKKVVLGHIIKPSNDAQADFENLVSFYKFVNPEPRYSDQFAYPKNL